MRLVKIKDALSSDDLNLVGIEKDRHLAVFLYLINIGFNRQKKADGRMRFCLTKFSFYLPSCLSFKIAVE